MKRIKLKLLSRLVASWFRCMAFKVRPAEWLCGLLIVGLFYTFTVGISLINQLLSCIYEKIRQSSEG